MKFCMSVLVAIAAVCSMAARSNADLILSVDLDSVTPGVQSTNTVPLLVGDQITATIYLEMTSPSTLGIYEFGVQYGTALSLVGRSEPVWTAGWSSDADPTNVNTPGFADRFDGFANSANGQTTAVAASPVATLTFQVVGPGTTFITPGFFDPNFDFLIAANGDDVTANGINIGGNVNVAAVPEPSSMALLATAGIGGWVARRRAARKAAK